MEGGAKPVSRSCYSSQISQTFTHDKSTLSRNDYERWSLNEISGLSSGVSRTEAKPQIWTIG